MVLELRRVGLHLEVDEEDTVKLLLSELLTNAIEHGFGGESDAPDARLVVTAEFRSDTGRLRILVADPAPMALPKARHAGPDATTGRGLRLIEELSTAFGYEVQAGEKTTWFELALLLSQDRQDDEATDAVTLSSTEQHQQRVTQQVALLDAYRGIRSARPSPEIGRIGPRRRDVIGDGGAAA